MRSSLTRWVVACAAGMVLAGCDDGPPADATAPAAGAPQPAKPATNPLSADMVAAVSSGKNAEIVGVHFSLNGIPTVGKALPVDIAIVPHRPMASILARFDARDGLALATGALLDRQVAPKPEKAIKHQLILLPSKEGVFMVTATVETETGDGAPTRVFSIPVIVGPAGGAPVDAPTPAEASPPAREPAANPPGDPPASG